MLREAGLAIYLKKPLELFNELRDQVIIFFDSETTGLSHTRHQLTEMAAVAVKGPSFDILEEFNHKIKLTDRTLRQIEEEKKIKDPKFFSVEKVLKYNRYHANPLPAHEEMEVLQGFKDFCGKHGRPYLVAQNAKFDLSFIGSRIGDISKQRVYDTKLMADYYFLPAVKALSEQGTLKEQIRQRLLTKGSRLSTSLEYLIKAFAIREKGLHNALTDVKAMVRVFQGIMKYFETYKEVIEDPVYQKEQQKAMRKQKEFKKHSMSELIRKIATFFVL